MAPTILERPTLGGYESDPTPSFNRPAYWYVRDSDNLPSAARAAAEPDPVVRVKLFDPQGSWSWYLAGYDPDRRLAFGAVDGWEFEVGDFWMPELTVLRGRLLRLPIERELDFEPRRLSLLLRQPRGDR